MLCKAVLSFKCNCVLYFFIWMSRGFAHYFFIWCTEHMKLCSSSGSLFFALQNYKKGHALKTITLTYYKYYSFISSNTTVTVTYMYINITYLNLVLGVPLTHLYLLSACIQASGKCGAKRREP